MREDLMEQLDRMFPNGYVLVYPTDNLKNVRTAISAPGRDKAQPSDHALRDAYEFLQEGRPQAFEP